MGASISYKRPPITIYQKDILDSEARFTVAFGATKIGKTQPHIIWLFEQALELKAGKSVWWVAPTYSQTEIAYRRMKNQIKPRSIFTVNESKLIITLITGGRIEFKTAEKPDNLYGEDVHAAVMDEFTRCREEAWFALRSTLTATQGKCKLIGNSKGKKNWGHKLGLKAKAGEPGYEYFKITAYDAIEQGAHWITLDEIEQAKRDLPDVVFRELYLAEPSEDGSNPFGIEAIRRNIRPLSSAQTVAYGVDLAKSVDWTVIVGLDRQGGITFFERFQKDWKQTKERIIQVVGKTPAFMDSTGVGDPITEDICRSCPNVQGFKYNSTNKQQMMEGLASDLSSDLISILAGTMQDEMESFEFEYNRGRVSYNAPQGMHDDCVNALGLARECKAKNPIRRFHVE